MVVPSYIPTREDIEALVSLLADQNNELCQAARMTLEGVLLGWEAKEQPA